MRRNVGIRLNREQLALVGEVVRIKLATMGKPQGWLAKKTGASLNTISRLVRATGEGTSGEVLEKVAMAFDMTLAQLLAEAGITLDVEGMDEERIRQAILKMSPEKIYEYRGFSPQQAALLAGIYKVAAAGLPLAMPTGGSPIRPSMRKARPHPVRRADFASELRSMLAHYGMADTEIEDVVNSATRHLRTSPTLRREVEDGVRARKPQTGELQPRPTASDGNGVQLGNCIIVRYSSGPAPLSRHFLARRWSRSRSHRQ